MKINGVMKQEQITIKDLSLDKLNSELAEQIRDNSKKVNVSTFTYRSSGNIVSGFLLLPKWVKNNLPCIIYNRGGYKDFGIVKKGYMFSSLAEIAKSGYVIIGSQNLGNSVSDGVDGYGGDADIKAVLDLFKIIRRNSFIDSTKIGMMGWSRGGITTYRCLAKVRWIRAAVVCAGVTNLISRAKLRPEMVKVFKESFGGDIIGKKCRSVLYWVNELSERVPILLMHGTADWRVSPLDSIELAEKLLKNKIPYRLVVFEGGDHGLTEFKEESRQMTVDWFDRYLKPQKPVLPDLKPHGP